MIYVLFGVMLSAVFILLMPRKSGLEREIEMKMKLGMELQRKGKLREYGELMKEIEEMENRWTQRRL